MQNFNHLDLNLLRVFDALMRERSVSIAAERLALTQPAVSNALSRLRRSLDDVLFVRTRNGMEPTAVALRIAEPIRQGLAGIRAGLTAGVAFDPATARRTFTFILNDVSEVTIIPPLFRIIEHEAPGLSIRVLEAGREEYEGLLDSGIADLAIGRVRLAETFRSELFVVGALVAVVPESHPLFPTVAAGEPITMANYLGYDHLVVIPRGATADPVERILRELGASRTVRVTVPHATVLPAILPGTSMIATIPDVSAPLLCADGRMAVSPLPFDVSKNKVYMYWHRRHDADPGQVWLRHQLRTIHYPWLDRPARAGERQDVAAA